MSANSEDGSVRHHLIVAGTGRAGTSLLVKILSACGLETELSRGEGHFWDDRANAGIETLPTTNRAHPYVLKSPWTYAFLDELLYRRDVRIDGLIVPIRDLREAAASRIIIELQNMHRSTLALGELLTGWCDWGLTPGGVTYSLEPLDQARILGQSLHLLLEKGLEHEIPICLLKFPKFARDPIYLYRNLTHFISSRVDSAQFEKIFHSIVSPEKIRVSSELTEAADSLVATSKAADAGSKLPSLERLENVALKRELVAKGLEIARASSEIGALTARCTELEAKLAAASLSADLIRRELDAEIEQRGANEARLRADIDHRAANEAALRADIEQRAQVEAALRRTLDKCEREIETWDAGADAVKAEIADLRDVLAVTDRKLRERTAEAKTTQLELQLARDNLAGAEHRASNHYSALAALQVETNSLRNKLAETERRVRDSESAAATRQAEITSLRIALGAERDIGKAALASLQITPAPIPPSQRNAGWLGATLRRFGRPLKHPLPSAG